MQIVMSAVSGLTTHCSLLAVPSDKHWFSPIDEAATSDDRAKLALCRHFNHGLLACSAANSQSVYLSASMSTT